MLSGSEDGNILLWELNSFKIIAIFKIDEQAKGIDKKIISLHFSFDGFFIFIHRGILFMYDSKKIGIF